MDTVALRRTPVTADDITHQLMVEAQLGNFVDLLNDNTTAFNAGDAPEMLRAIRLLRGHLRLLEKESDFALLSRRAILHKSDTKDLLAESGEVSDECQGFTP